MFYSWSYSLNGQGAKPIEIATTVSCLLPLPHSSAHRRRSDRSPTTKRSNVATVISMLTEWALEWAMAVREMRGKAGFL